jgi:uncharacterized membrane protein
MSSSVQSSRGLMQCAICKQQFAQRDLVPGASVRDSVAEQIKRDHVEWSSEQFICRTDLNTYRARYVHSLLASEKGELTSLEKEVVASMHDHELLAKNVDNEAQDKWTYGERLADKIASFGGSWSFLISFGVFITIWIIINSAVIFWHPADPYPFILLNLVLSCLAAIQAPVIMMSQNRQEAKDRLRSEHDYQINLKAELEIRHLHEKVDHLLSHQWERLVAIQEVQLELLAELGKRR